MRKYSAHMFMLSYVTMISQGNPTFGNMDRYSNNKGQYLNLASDRKQIAIQIIALILDYSAT